MSLLDKLFDKKKSGQPKKAAVVGDQDAEWTDKPLVCPKCGTTLHEKTPRFGMVQCGQCGASLKIVDYQFQ